MEYLRRCGIIPSMTRAAAHQMLDDIPDDDLDEVATLLEAYRHNRDARPFEEIVAELGMSPFDAWCPVKQSLTARTKVAPTVEREIWWCSIGFNVGGESYGKGPRFTRPVLILKKLNYATFIGIPMSTKLKVRDDYHILTFDGKDVALMLGEIRKFDSRRLADKMGILSEEKFKLAWQAVLKCIQPRAV